ncbi:MAG: hypothetical protein WD270_07545 [Acetobacterales bacterium]
MTPPDLADHILTVFETHTMNDKQEVKFSLVIYTDIILVEDDPQFDAGLKKKIVDFALDRFGRKKYGSLKLISTHNRTLP